MESELLRYSEKDGVGEIVFLSTKDGVTLSVARVEQLHKLLLKIADDSKATTLILRSDGPDFCLGIDLRDFPKEGGGDIHGFSRWEKCLRQLERMPQATIAALTGRAFGGGFQIALACDLRVAAQDAIFALPEVRMGFLPGMSVFRMTKFVGLGRARDMILTGRSFGVNEAFALGLVDRIADGAGMEAVLSEAVTELSGSDRTALYLARRLLDESFEQSYEDFIGGFLAAQDRATKGERFTKQVKAAHENNTPQGKKQDS